MEAVLALATLWLAAAPAAADPKAASPDARRTAAAPAVADPKAAGGRPFAPELVDAVELVEGLVLDIRYATEDNFLRRRLYDAPRCLLRPSVAARLARAQSALAREGFRLKAFDCYRPLSVQKAMWDAMPVRGLVAPPSRGGSNHNRGAAVDVGLVRLDGSAVELPTDHDFFGPEAHAASPLPSPAARRHRAVLQAAMAGAGFKRIRLEWWHFDDPDALRYGALDRPLSSGPDQNRRLP